MKGKKRKLHVKKERMVPITSDKGTSVQRTHKDTLFRFIFRDKRKLLQLYNAVNGSEYLDESELLVTTLENVVYLGYKNDVSFLLDWVLCLVEQQSTWNPNIPLRGVLYFARLYREFVAKNQYDLYGTTQIPVPFPQYIVFYNGTRKRPEREVLRLSDAFPKPVHLAEEFAAPALECCALVLDINYGKNQELLEKCKPLLDYSRFIHYIRENIKQGLSAENAVDEAVTRCLKEDILTDVLTAHRREVVGMFLEEYDEELHNRTLRKEGHEDGIADLNTLAQKMIADNRVEELLCSFTDKQLQKRLFKEYNL